MKILAELENEPRELDNVDVKVDKPGSAPVLIDVDKLQTASSVILPPTADEKKLINEPVKEVEPVVIDAKAPET